MTRAAGRTARILAAVAVTLAPALVRAQSADTDTPAASRPAAKKPPTASKPTPPPPRQPQAPAAFASGSGSSSPAAATAARPHASLVRPRRSFRTSIDDYVERVFRSHEDPCAKATREGVPCFPVSIEQDGPRFSVAEAMRRYRIEGGPAPNQLPTNAEVHQQMSGAPQSASGGVSFDPGCTVKSLIRMVSGGTNTFYLYRTWNGDVERPLLTDHKLDPNTFLRLPNFRYEFVGEYKGECEAVAAWRSAVRNPTPPPAADEGANPPPAEGSAPP